jgi:kynureninase
MDATNREYALALDAKDPLAKYKSQFVIADPEICYLDGNSLGRLPKKTVDVLHDFLDNEWGKKVVDGWPDWIDDPEIAGNTIGRASLGAAEGQVIALDTISVNFYQLVMAALRARPGRKTIIIDAANFPTDRYIVQGIAEQHGLKLITLDNESTPDHEMITPELLKPHMSEDVALVTFQIIQYRSGARNNVKAITDLAHSYGALTIWDASHACGSIDIQLDRDGADMAVGCTYKYGNSGPGASGWLYVRREIQKDLRVPIQGWFAQKDQFAMGPIFERVDGIRGFMIASPNIMSLRAITTSYSMIEEAGIAEMERKRAQGTEMMVDLYDAWLAKLGFELMTPRKADARGGHITIKHPEGKRIAVAMRKFIKVIPDYREPNSVRLAISPLPTSYTEVWDGFDRIRNLVETRGYERIDKVSGRVT